MEDYFDLDRQQNQAWSILNMEFLLYAMRNESVRRKWTELILESVEQISKLIQQMDVKTDEKSKLSSEELAWTILSLENGMAIFHFIAKDNVPVKLYERHCKIFFTKSLFQRKKVRGISPDKCSTLKNEIVL
jgi:hypothetical protein